MNGDLNISTCNEFNSMLGKPTINDFVALRGQRKIVCLTAYGAPIANALDPHWYMLLAGDSVGMVVYGMDTKQNGDLSMITKAI